MAVRQSSLEGVELMADIEFYRGKRVFVTGHTGFKGTWLSKILLDAGAIVTGYALDPPTDPSLFAVSKIGRQMQSVTGDIRDLPLLMKTVEEARPEIVFHLAAQPIVRESYVNPVSTYGTNVMGTVHILECVRKTGCVKSFLNITTDKVYRNREWEWGYRETDELDGYDPYSNSKSCSELVTHSYRQSFLEEAGIPVSTARAGNVIGGGDFAPDRILPDCIRAAQEKEPILVRNPRSTRPYQHVLEPLSAYLLIAQRQYGDPGLAGCYNVGPEEGDCITTGQLADIFCRSWGEGQTWINQSQDGPHEANFLKLDCSRIKRELGWKPVWHVQEAVEKTVAWAKAYLAGEDAAAVMEQQIKEYWKKQVKESCLNR